MSQVKNGVTYTVIALLGLIALVLGVFFAAHLKTEALSGDFYGTKLNQPRTLASFDFEGIDGKVFNNASLNGQWTMFFFGFTHCSSVCPTTMAELSKMMYLLRAKKASTLPRVVMISIDPARDKAANLARYVRAFDSDFYGARAKPEALLAMTQALGIAYEKVDNGNSADTFQHSGTITLINPQGEVVAFFTPPLDAKHLAHDFLSFVS